MAEVGVWLEGRGESVDGEGNDAGADLHPASVFADALPHQQALPISAIAAAMDSAIDQKVSMGTIVSGPCATAG